MHMQNKGTVIAVVLAIIIAGGSVFYWPQLLVPMQRPVSSEPYMVSYQSPQYSLSFQHPSNLYAFERTDAGTPERPQLSLFLVEDTKENRDVLEGRTTEPREGPTGITIDVYPNPEELSSDAWVTQDTNWVVANSSMEPVTVAGIEGVSYTWSGLYEGKTVVATKGTKAYVFSVTWMTPEDQILKDFDTVLNSLSL